jgi:hypothetical protein
MTARKKCQWLEGVVAKKFSATDRCTDAVTHAVHVDGALVGHVCARHAERCTAHFWRVSALSAPSALKGSK